MRAPSSPTPSPPIPTQSTDPDSAHFSDMTQLFSDEGWVDLPFQMGDILSDPELESIMLQEPR
jgi:hypothetical protein